MVTQWHSGPSRFADQVSEVTNLPAWQDQQGWVLPALQKQAGQQPARQARDAGELPLAPPVVKCEGARPQARPCRRRTPHRRPVPRTRRRRVRPVRRAPGPGLGQSQDPCSEPRRPAYAGVRAPGLRSGAARTKAAPARSGLVSGPGPALRARGRRADSAASKGGASPAQVP